MSYDHRRDWLVHNVDEEKKRSFTTPNRGSRRECTLKWRFGSTQVCKCFFLHTIGYHGDQVVKSALKNIRKDGGVVVGAHGDRRGQHVPQNKFDEGYRKHVIDHIESFRPQVSHYRRDHAPNRRYLPSDLSICSMHQVFNESQQASGQDQCSFQYYYKVFSSMNISFSSPENDLCKTCLIHEQAHPPLQASADDLPHNCSTCNCHACSGYVEHKTRAAQARAALNADTERMKNDDQVLVTTVDMQKTICMPKLPTKDYYFSRKLVLFNETFASPGKDAPAVAVLWHEGEAGRKAYNVASAYLTFLRFNRDIQEVILFADNCSAQNKNWTLFSAFPRMVNNPSIGITCISLKYLEPGHTFMAADSVHGSITTKLKSKSEVYDFQDYIELIEKSRKQLKCATIDHKQMFLFEHQANKTSVLLKDIKVVQFRRGSIQMFYKTSHNQEDFLELGFLKKVSARELTVKMENGEDPLASVPVMERPRGISALKKTDLMTLASMIPRYTAAFFEQLLVIDKSEDLETVEDY